MTIQIFGPSPQGPCGPGVVLSANVIGTEVPAGSVWRVEVLDIELPGSQVLMRHQLPAGPGVPVAIGGLLGDPRLGALSFPSFQSLTLDGDACSLRIDLISSSTGLPVDTITQPQFWDASYYFRIPAQSSSTAGFTEADRAELAIVKSSVWRDEGISPVSGLPVIGQVIDLLRGPPRSVLRLGSSQLISGRGSLGTVDPSLGLSFGGTWSWFTVPIEFGFIDGQLDEYSHRMAQFVILREGADDSTYRDELVDANAEGGTITWKIPAPTEVLYDLAPGLVGVWRWLV